MEITESYGQMAAIVRHLVELVAPCGWLIADTTLCSILFQAARGDSIRALFHKCTSIGTSCPQKRSGALS